MRDFLDLTSAALGGAGTATVVAFDDDGHPLVCIDGSAPVAAQSLIPLDPGLVGATVAVLRIGGVAGAALILGRLHPPLPVVMADGKAQVIEAERELVLRCGKASIRLTADGAVIVRGTRILSRAEGDNRIQGGSVSLN